MSDARSGDARDCQRFAVFAAPLEQSQRAPQRSRGGLAFVGGHSLGIEFEPQMRGRVLL